MEGELAATYGAICLIPIAVIIVLSLITKKTFEPLLISTVIAVILYAGTGFLPEFVGLLLKEMGDPTIGWVILVCGCMGSLLYILEKSNAASAFADVLSKFATTRKRALFVTWLLGLCLFIDDYLNVLTVGNTMKKVTDKHRISRSMLAYSVGSTAAPIVILAPISTWAIFFATLLDGEGVAGPDGTAFGAYLQCIPYLFYGWICAFIIMPLVFTGVIPLVGPMRAQEKAARENGVLFPPGVEPPAEEEPVATDKKTGGPFDFVLPLLVLIFATIFAGKDLLTGAIIALVFTSVLYVLRKFATPSEIVEQFWNGFTTMLQIFGLLVLAFSFKDACANLGFVEYVIAAVQPIMQGALLPAVVFVSTAAMAFAMANFWGLAAIVIPLVVPLSMAMDVNIYISAAAVFSGAAFGSHACFYADAAILIGKATNIRPYDHAITQLPYALLAAVLSTVLYLIFGFR
jgi:Na+/H+ antiporter NhaC